jgi:hypothetical protein
MRWGRENSTRLPQPPVSSEFSKRTGVYLNRAKGASKSRPREQDRKRCGA